MAEHYNQAEAGALPAAANRIHLLEEMGGQKGKTMEIAKVKVTGTRAETIEALDIPEGIVGATVSFEFGPEWAGLTKNVVFVGAKDVEILNIQDSVYLPPEVVSAPNIIVKVGIVGVDANKKMVIPTLWADLGTVKPGAPVGMGYEPTLPIWAQLMGMIGDLRGLNTADKSNLVAAINEAMSKSGTAGGYYTPVVTQPTTNTMKIAFVPSVATMPAVEPVTITLPGSDSGQKVDLTEFDTRLSALENAGDTAGIFTGKTASFYGDSLTEVNYHYTKGYHKWVSEILALASYNNYGKSGNKVSDVYSKVNSVTDTADIVFVMCGVNDQCFSVPLGAIDDTTTATTYGALNLLCALLKQKYPTSIIVFITPHYQTKYPHSEGITSYEVAKAVREVCEKYAIPVYDNFALSGIYSTNLSTFTTDNCHWNDTGHEMVGKNLARFMVNSFRYIHGNNSSGGTHTHSYTETVTTAATCTTAGVKTFACECGDSYTESIPATGHSWNDGVVTVEPTEETEGVRTYTCTVCGETRTETIPTLDHEHSYVSNVVAPTCTEQGYTEHVCACGDSYKDTYVAATGHSYTSEVTTEPTCTTEGVRTYTCSVCGDTYTENIAKTAHNYVDGVCSVCGNKSVTMMSGMEITGVQLANQFHICLYVSADDLPAITNEAPVFGFTMEPLTEFVPSNTPSGTGGLYVVDTVNDLSAGYSDVTGDKRAAKADIVDNGDGTYSVTMTQNVLTYTADRAFWLFPISMTLAAGNKFNLANAFVNIGDKQCAIHAIGGAFIGETFAVETE